MTIEMKKSESGFTLVELAIVMIIVGLLIGGVLKGQAMIDNQRVNSTVSQIKAMDAATTTFRDMYNAMPGDMQNPGTRLPNCTGNCVPTADAANGNGRVDQSAFGAATVLDSENGVFFQHLAAADLLGGVRPGGNLAFGDGLLAATVGSGNGYVIGYSADGDFDGGLGGMADGMGGHYLALVNTTVGLTGASGQGLSQSHAFRVDSKLDDGAPHTGNVIAQGTFAAAPASAADCAVNDAGAEAYAEAYGTLECGLFIRFQN